MSAETTPFTDAALAYAKGGWPVFPLLGKIPRIKGGQGCLDATTDNAAVFAWWKKWPKSNVGIATGETAGFFVVDVDGPAGFASLAALEAKHGPLPTTLTAATGGGGRHILFNYPAGTRVGNSSRTRLGAGLDTRGTGGYIVAPPSVHPDTGAFYEWDSPPETTPMADAPDWLIEMLTADAAPTERAAPSPLVEITGDREQKYGLRALAVEAAELAATTEGGRNDRLNVAALRIGQLSVATGVTEHQAADALLGAAKACGLKDAESRATFASGWRKGLSTPRDVPPSNRPQPTPPRPKTPLPQVGLEPLTEAQLCAVVDIASYRNGLAPYPAGYKKLDMAKWIAHFGLTVHEVPWEHGRKWKLDACPWDNEHTDAGMSQRTEGATAAWCSHPDCKTKKWADLREKYDPKGAPKALRVREAMASAIPDVVADIPSNLHEMFANYVALVGTESIFDRRTGRTITMTALKLAHPLEVKAWVEGPERLSVDVDKLVFRPEGSDPGEFNLFTGLPKLEVIDRSGVTAWLDHGNSMANDADIAFWLFSRFAYKIQNPGKKVVSSVVIHGEQGTGKNLFFAPLLAIYGKYGAVIGQQQIESPYTDWLSGKLLLVADEVASRGERYHIKNKLKGLISGDTIAINAKFQATRWERNCADLHFLSNEEIPVVVEPGDRRFAVIRYDVVHPKPYFAQLAAVDPGALYEMLMEWDCGAFNAHTEPPPTKAKTDLVDLTKEPSDRFLDAWLAAELPIPAAGGATGADLFRAYDVWTKANNERKVIQSSIEFGRIVAKRLSQFQIRVNDGHPRVWSTDGARPESEGIREFSAALARWILAEQKARV